MQVALPIAEIQQAAKNPEFLNAVAALYARLDARIAARAPVCTNRGACCRFAEYGHSLFVTAAEVAYFVARAETPLLAPPDRSYCPYQVDGMCRTRETRPAGCRIYFCDPAAQHWQPEETEAAIRELADLGQAFGIPYAYVEWTDALRQIGGRTVDQPAGPTVALRIDSHERPS